jgi:hypothetical protein
LFSHGLLKLAASLFLTVRRLAYFGRAVTKWLLHQRNMVVREPTARHREFSIRSMLCGAVFIIMLVAAVIVDLAALLQFSGLISGLPANILKTSILEIGGILTALTIFPLLAMGMSISMDQNRSEDT